MEEPFVIRGWFGLEVSLDVDKDIHRAERVVDVDEAGAGRGDGDEVGYDGVSGKVQVRGSRPHLAAVHRQEACGCAIHLGDVEHVRHGGLRHWRRPDAIHLYLSNTSRPERTSATGDARVEDPERADRHV